ncbi:polysaccharide pyruvyl transferase family protein [Brachybacterium sp. YJGR34]|uniref:polysaccharide pyruvyl transferase family protein n=1 Tax=Brachybacterium sp. YJGR34 TaxID=2059911 RepID=UPI000E0BE0E8|nr:polysaccharide pyruvyl transferase family protein [Brachybacterium sp. YJGR34]
MRALVLWARPDHPNLGVAALATGSAALLRRAFGEDLDVRFHATGGADLPGNDGPVNLSHAGPLLRTRIRDPRPLREWLRGFDLVLDTRAGDSFTDIYTLKQLAKMTQAGLYARQWGVPLVLGPQTVGPFGTRRGRALARLSLRAATGLMVRDTASADAARALGRPADVVSTDVVFALAEVPREQRHDVLLNVSGLLWHPNPHVDHRHYRDVVHGLLDGLAAQGRTVSLLAHVARGSGRGTDSDAAVVAALADRVSGEAVIPDDLTEVRAAVAASRLVIGSRMHACLNALSTGTPAVALAYSRKFAPLLEQVGWRHTIDLRPGDVRPADLLALAEQQDLLTSEATAVRARADVLVERAVRGLRGMP